MPRTLAPLVALVLVLAGCAGAQVRAVPDTPQAKAVLGVMSRYRKAMETRNIPEILAIASPDYHDDLGTEDGSDDLTYADLKPKLTKDFAHLKTLRLDMEVLKMVFNDKQTVATVTYRYDLRFQTHMPAGDKWHDALDVKRMVVRLEGHQWKVVSGL